MYQTLIFDICVEIRDTHHKDSVHHRDHSSSSSPQNTVSVLTDHHPVNHQEESQNTQTSPDSIQDIIERSEIRQISNSVTVNTIIPEEQCAQNIISVSEEQCTQTHYFSVRRTVHTDLCFGISKHRNTRREMRATHSTFYRRAGSVRVRITDHSKHPSRARYALLSTPYRHGYQQSNRASHGTSRVGSKTHQ